MIPFDFYKQIIGAIAEQADSARGENELECYPFDVEVIEGDYWAHVTGEAVAEWLDTSYCDEPGCPQTGEYTYRRINWIDTCEACKWNDGDEEDILLSKDIIEQIDLDRLTRKEYEKMFAEAFTALAS